jgi:hypothetical protein
MVIRQRRCGLNEDGIRKWNKEAGNRNTGIQGTGNREQEHREQGNREQGNKGTGNKGTGTQGTRDQGNVTVSRIHGNTVSQEIRILACRFLRYSRLRAAPQTHSFTGKMEKQFSVLSVQCSAVSFQLSAVSCQLSALSIRALLKL